MSHAAICARPGQNRTSLYQEITDKIIAELEAGRLPYRRPPGVSPQPVLGLGSQSESSAGSWSRERLTAGQSQRSAMSHAAVCARPGQNRTSLYQEITDKIIAELEAGRLPWGTSAVQAPPAMPKNAATQRRYSEINLLILWGAVVQHGFPGQSWLTLRQALSLGGNVRKGERGTTVVFADRFISDQERARAREQGDEPNTISFLKRFTVFNVAQCDGLPAELVTVPPPVPDGLILPDVEALIRASGADLRLGGDKAFYSPILDYIQVLRPEACFEPIN